MNGNIIEIFQDMFDKMDRKEKRYSSICKVVSIDTTKRICQLEPINGDAERKGRLQASIELTTGIYVKPTLKSYVLLSFINNQTGVITQYSEIDSIETITSDGAKLSLTDKINISNSTDDLKTILNSLISAIKLITVPTPSGTSGVPLNVADFTNINTDINNLLT